MVKGDKAADLLNPTYRMVNNFTRNESVGAMKLERPARNVMLAHSLGASCMAEIQITIECLMRQRTLRILPFRYSGPVSAGDGVKTSWKLAPLRLSIKPRVRLTTVSEKAETAMLG